MDLVEWLLAQIAEDEAMAREEIADGYGGSTTENGWSSDRVLAECESKRRIVELNRAEWAGVVGEPNYCSQTIDEIFRLLALPYADAPGYENWRP